MLKVVVTALGLLLALASGGAALAQRPAPTVIAPAPRVAAPPSRSQARTPPIRLPVAPQDPVLVIAPGALDLYQQQMEGWTALTGPVMGGASVVRLPNGEGRLLIRAADSLLTVAPISLANPGGMIDGSLWTSPQVAIQSEPHCQALMAPGSLVELLCGYLGPNGSAKVTYFGLYGADRDQTRDLGGSGAGFRPTIMPEPSYSVEPISPIERRRRVGFEAYVWDGNLGLFRQAVFTIQTERKVVFPDLTPDSPVPGSGGGGGGGGGAWLPFPPQPQDPALPTGWVRMASALPTPYGCARRGDGVLCVVGTLTGHVRIVDAVGSDFAGPQVLLALTQAVPGGLTRNIAPVLVVASSGQMSLVARNQAGRLYRSTISNMIAGPWVDEGGFATTGSGIACITGDDDQPLCFIQGPGGGIYWKRLG